ncbi:MAG: HEAT repeat domain-containing protein [Pirellulales bacterium]|nr:HEAT repeat domain-containing protein [Pirellulales bacterium]
MKYLLYIVTASIAIASHARAAEPVLLDDRFRLPEGFHIYLAAEPELTGGSYDLTFDGMGRLLVADGQAVRRLADNDKDGVFDTQETIADGPSVAGRGPQGLLVYGDHLYAVGGDGVQLFRGYQAGGRLAHVRRLGEQFHTGGDHGAHTVLRGLDGYVYLVTGDGAGTTGRKHITELSSPVLEERLASVFRLDPTGKKWECVGSGGRNPPSLGMNYLGELFSLDSDMEFHVDVPFYRPVRLNHWATGCDQGWQHVGAFPPYYVDCLPGVLDVGRGSPNWGVFYEHSQLPQKYRDAFFVCDYRWKSATTGQYATSGRLVVFHLRRDGATWQAELSELASAKPGATDVDGNPINFALVDVEVAPDGSLFVTDHNQGVWRIFYDPATHPSIPEIVPGWAPTPPSANKNELLSALLKLPQPAAEWSRLREEQIKAEAGFSMVAALQSAALDGARPLRMRLRAVRLLAPGFVNLPATFITELSYSSDAEMRAQAAWLTGVRGNAAEHHLLVRLLDDPDAFVRRRAAEALSRCTKHGGVEKLVLRLGDTDRYVRYAAMTALVHQPTEDCFSAAARLEHPAVLSRLLVAAHLRKERPEVDAAIDVIMRLLNASVPTAEDELDRLRVLALYRKEIQGHPACRRAVASHLLASFPHDDPRIRWEQIRLLGAYQIPAAFPVLVDYLLNEQERVTQFHVASALAEIPRPPEGFDKARRERFADWLLSTQTIWFNEVGGKGRQFPAFWATVLNKLAEVHADTLATRLQQMELDSQLARATFAHLDVSSGAVSVLIENYQKVVDLDARRHILSLLEGFPTAEAASFLTCQIAETREPSLRESLFTALAPMGQLVERPVVFLGGLFEFEDSRAIGACSRGLVASRTLLSDIDGGTELATSGYKGERAVFFRLLELMARLPDAAKEIEQSLISLSGYRPPRVHLDPRCIWSTAGEDSGRDAWFAKTFDIDGIPGRGELVLACDNELSAYVNGNRVGGSKVWNQPLHIDISDVLQTGENLIAVHGKNDGGPAGLIGVATWSTSGGARGGIATDTTWKTTVKPGPHWQTEGASESNWRQAADVAEQQKHTIEAFSAFRNSIAGNESLALQELWHKWYLQRYREPFVASELPQSVQRSDREIHELIVGIEKIEGNVNDGRALYLKAGCYACHGGLEDQKTTIFGPALGGVTLRLNRSELADAIVFPSKQVVERFKTSVVLTSDGQTVSGFVTEKSDTFVSITDIENKVTRLPRDEVESIQLQDVSLMPERLLSGFSDDQIRDLLAFLASLK